MEDFQAKEDGRAVEWKKFESLNDCLEQRTFPLSDHLMKYIEL